MKNIQIIAVNIVIASLIVFGGIKYASTKVAYVDNNKLIMEYEGSKKAQEEIKVKITNWQANVDTLGSELEQKVKIYQEEQEKLSSKQKQEREEELYNLQQQFYQYREAIQQKMAEEDAKVTGEVVGEINEFVENYAKDNGYLIIFGASGNGNMVYASQSLDITGTILEKMNKTTL